MSPADDRRVAHEAAAERLLDAARLRTPCAPIRDLLPDLRAATNGYVVDKVEGFAIDKDGNAFVVTDNDGVDDSSGETLFLRLGSIAAIN